MISIYSIPVGNVDLKSHIQIQCLVNLHSIKTFITMKCVDLVHPVTLDTVQRFTRHRVILEWIKVQFNINRGRAMRTPPSAEWSVLGVTESSRRRERRKGPSHHCNQAHPPWEPYERYGPYRYCLTRCAFGTDPTISLYVLRTNIYCYPQFVSQLASGKEMSMSHSLLASVATNLLAPAVWMTSCASQLIYTRHTVKHPFWSPSYRTRQDR